MSEFSYIPESPEQSPFNNQGIFSPTDIYNLDEIDKWTQLGQLDHIQTQSGSGVAQIDFTAIKQAEYNIHLLHITDFNVATDGQPTAIRLSNESDFLTSSYQWANTTARSGGTFEENKSTSSTYLEIARLNGNTTNEKLSGYVYFYNLGKNDKFSFLTNITVYTNEFSAEMMTCFGGGVHPTKEVIKSIRLTTTSGNVSATSVSLYGVKGY